MHSIDSILLAISRFLLSNNLFWFFISRLNCILALSNSSICFVISSICEAVSLSILSSFSCNNSSCSDTFFSILVINDLRFKTFVAASFSFSISFLSDLICSINLLYSFFDWLNSLICFFNTDSCFLILAKRTLTRSFSLSNSVVSSAICLFFSLSFFSIALNFSTSFDKFSFNLFFSNSHARVNSLIFLVWFSLTIFSSLARSLFISADLANFDM